MFKDEDAGEAEGVRSLELETKMGSPPSSPRPRSIWGAWSQHSQGRPV